MDFVKVVIGVVGEINETFTYEKIKRKVVWNYIAKEIDDDFTVLVVTATEGSNFVKVEIVEHRAKSEALDLEDDNIN